MSAERNVLVTGVSRGIGRAIATRLLEDGWLVHGTYRVDSDAADSLSRSFPTLVLHQADLSLDSDLDGLIAALGGIERFGRHFTTGCIDLDAVRANLTCFANPCVYAKAE